MTKCCACNKSGVCKACKCVRSDRKCSNCAPLHHGKCQNNTSFDKCVRSQPITSLINGLLVDATPSKSRTIRRRVPCSSVPDAVSDTVPDTVVRSFSAEAQDSNTDGEISFLQPSFLDSSPSLQLPSSCPPLLSVRTCSGPPVSNQVTSTGSADSTAKMECTCSKEGTCASCHLKPTCHVKLNQPECSSDENFCEAISDAYERVVHWRRNVFNVPYGASGGAFVDELARLIRGFAEANSLRLIAWKAVGVACHLLLQRPNDKRSAPAQTNIDHLRRRLDLWKSGKISQLMDEALCIQEHLPGWNARKNGASTLSDTVFSKLVFAGQIHSAIRYVSGESSNGVLGMDQPVPGSSKTVRHILLEKHPEPVIPPAQALMDGEPLSVNPILFERLTPELIKNIGRRAQGAAGPSGLDAEAWTHAYVF